MKRFLCLIAVGMISGAAFAAPACAQSADKPAEAKQEPAGSSAAPKEESSVTEHSIKIGATAINYTSTAATILVKNEKDEPTASLYYMAYTKKDVKDASSRPLTFCYNGGPGSSSIWLHMGAFGPRRVVTADAEATPPAPYHVVDNASSLLDKTDLVFIDPVGTGFSHAVGKAQDKDFWGVDEDVHSLAQFISAYVSRNSRWNSPKYLLGESYGTYRSAALVDYLQSNDGMDFNGVVLISSVLDLTQLVFPQGLDLDYVLYLPSYAATAWYHKALKDQPSDLNAFLNDARKFAAGEYADALMKGDALSASDKAAIAEKVAHFTGLSADYVRKADLRVNLAQFRVELQRSRDLITGRLDARFTGAADDPLAEFAQRDPQSDAITSAYTAAFNNYVRDELKFGMDKTYHVSSNGAGGSWNWKREGAGGFFASLGLANVEGDLAEAITRNPHLHVEVENGLYDLATPFFATEYTMQHLGLPEKLQKNIELQYYDAGHMMYVNEAQLEKLKANVAKFIDSTSHP